MGSGQQAAYDELQEELRAKKLAKLQGISTETLLECLLRIQASLQSISGTAVLSRGGWANLDEADRILKILL